MKTRTVAGVAAALALGTATAYAQGPLSDWKALDANADQTITTAEAQSFADTQFQQMDTDRNGQLSQAEYVDSRLAYLKALDQDGDGALTRAELRDQFMAARQRK